MALPVLADRVKESSDTTGPGTLELNGAAAGYLSFVQAVGDGARCYYVITDGSEFEVGVGTVSAGAANTLSRDTILQTSNNDTAAIEWGSGTRDVFLTLPASQMVTQDRYKEDVNGNVLINPDFRISQRSPGVPGTWTTNGYTVDRWYFDKGSNTGVATRASFSKGQIAVPGEPQFHLAMERSTTSSDMSLSQKIEGVRTLAGQTCTVSYWAKAETAISAGHVTVAAVQHFGSGGSSDNANSFDNPVISTAWQRFTSTLTLDSISGTTIGDGDALVLRFTLASGAGDNKIWLANVKLEAGDIAGDYRPRPIGEELALCQRYYFKTFPQDIGPTVAGGRAGALRTLAASDGNFVFDVRFPSVMRVSPSVSVYDTTFGSSTAAFNQTGGSTETVTVSQTSEVGTLIAATTPAVDDANDLIEIHVTADAEL